MKLQIALFNLLLLLSGCAQKKNYRLSKNLYEQSLLESKNQNFKRALHLANQAIEKYDNPQAQAQKAILLYQLGKLNESLALFKRLSKDKQIPSTIKTDILNNYACTLLSLNKPGEAKKIWTELTADSNYLSPEVAWYNIGLMELLESKKKPNDKKEYQAKAEEAFGNALSISKEYIDAQFYLAITQVMLDKLEVARQNLIEIVTIAPEHSSAKAILERLDKETTINWD